MRVVQQTLFSRPYLSPALNFWQVEKDGVGIWADWEAAEGTGALGQPELSTGAFCASSPHLPALLRTGTSREFSARLSPKDVPPTHTVNTHLVAVSPQQTLSDPEQKPVCQAALMGFPREERC